MKKTTVNCIQCPNCSDIIYSRSRHDYHTCSCGGCAIDGGSEYTKVVYRPGWPAPSLFSLELPYSERELHHDWNFAIDKLGIIKL